MKKGIKHIRGALGWSPVYSLPPQKLFLRFVFFFYSPCSLSLSTGHQPSLLFLFSLLVLASLPLKGLLPELSPSPLSICLLKNPSKRTNPLQLLLHGPL